MIKKSHISLLAVRSPFFVFSSENALFPRSFSNSASASIAFNPAGVAAHPSPNIFAIILVAIYLFAG